MVKYKQTSITSKEGVNFVRSVVEGGSLFHKVEHENDLGIDGVIEFIRAEQPLHKMVAVQIKSGPSFYVPDNGECKIPIENHREYWTKYRLPVVGLVYVPALDCAYWVNVKDYLERRTVIRRNISIPLSFLISEGRRLTKAIYTAIDESFLWKVGHREAN